MGNTLEVSVIAVHKPRMNLIFWLEDLTRDSLAVAGGKGAGLGELLRAGLPVPPGFVVAVSAYHAHIDHARLTDRIRERLQALAAEDPADAKAAATEICGWIEATDIPEDVQREIVAAYRELGKRAASVDAEPMVAVRSSATAEDLPDASFAGQQETYLDVRGEAAVLAAVRRCWASLFSARALSYRARMGFDRLGVGLAVVVQVMVPAEVAGVMFTANPVTGAEDELVVTASYGLGDVVVGGVVTPDTFVLDRRGSILSRTLGAKQQKTVSAAGEVHLEAIPEGDRARFCIGEASLQALAELGYRASRHFGAPQDIEWAMAGNRLYLLQSRPITTLVQRPAAASRVQRLWDRLVARHAVQEMMEHFPDMPKPLDFIVLEGSMDGVAALLAEFGVIFPPAASFTEEFPNGRMAFRLRPPRVSPSIVWRLPHRLTRALRESPGEQWGPISREFEREIGALCEPAVERLGTSALVQMIEAIVDASRRYAPLRFTRVFVAGSVHTGLVVFWVRRAVRKTEAATRIRELYLGVPYSTASMIRDVQELARIASDRGRGPEFRGALDDFLARWGNRPVRGLVALPSVATWREEPGAVTGLVDALVADPTALDIAARDARQQREFEAAREAVIRGLGRLGRRSFAASLRRAREYLVAREGDFVTFERGIAHVRRAARELGSRLHAAGVLAAPDDIFFVRAEEIGPLARGEFAHVRARIERRKHAYERVHAARARGENWLTASGSLPSEYVPSARRGGDGRLVGVPASPGRAAGHGCVVRGASDFGKLKPGDVLIAQVTAPAWTPLFAVASAVVTETGGALSHAAIVAREYGIPAVLAVKDATTLLEHGRRVVVDGTAGYVEREIVS